jgi:hypothetical protein
MKYRVHATISVRTVTFTPRTIGIALASTLAVVFIAVAVVISGPLPFHLNKANAESTHDLLVSYAAKDSDNDGLPDWEEALYGTDPTNPHSVNANVTDGDAVSQGLVKPKFASATSTPISASAIPGVSAAPTTVTDQFARALFSQYLSQHTSVTPTPDEIATFVEQGVSDLSNQQTAPDAFNAGQVHVVGTGSDALVSYAAQAESTMAKNTVSSDKNEIEYFGDVVEKNDLTALPKIKKIGAAYTTLAKAYIAIPVPKEAAVPHLAVANAMARIGGDITDMSTMTEDPLRAYLGLAKYEKDVPALQSALAALQGVYVSEGVTIPQGTSGAFFIGLLNTSTTKTP